MRDADGKSALSHDSFMEIVTAINAALTIDDLLAGIPTTTGISMASYHHFAAVGAYNFKNLRKYYAHNIPQWLLDYYDRHEKHNAYPGVRATFSNGEFLWLSDMIEHPFVKEAEHDIFLTKMMQMSGDGLCMPLYGPHNRLGYMFVAFDRHKSACSPVLGFQAQAMAQKFHVRYCLMIDKMQKTVKLSTREAEVLELITFGKSNSDIGEILDISSHTVGGYVRKLFLKLDVGDRVSAVLRAQSIKLEF